MVYLGHDTGFYTQSQYTVFEQMLSDLCDSLICSSYKKTLLSEQTASLILGDLNCTFRPNWWNRTFSFSCLRIKKWHVKNKINSVYFCMIVYLLEENMQGICEVDGLIGGSFRISKEREKLLLSGYITYASFVCILTRTVNIVHHMRVYKPLWASHSDNNFYN